MNLTWHILHSSLNTFTCYTQERSTCLLTSYPFQALNSHFYLKLNSSDHSHEYDLETAKLVLGRDAEIQSDRVWDALCVLFFIKTAVFSIMGTVVTVAFLIQIHTFVAFWPFVILSLTRASKSDHCASLFSITERIFSHCFTAACSLQLLLSRVVVTHQQAHLSQRVTYNVHEYFVHRL